MLPAMIVTLLDCSTNRPLYGCIGIDMQAVPRHAEHVHVSAMSGDVHVVNWIVARVEWIVRDCDEQYVHVFLVPVPGASSGAAVRLESGEGPP